VLFNINIYLRIFIVIILLIGAIFIVANAFYYLFYPYDMQLDSYVVHNLVRFLKGGSLYKYSCQTPYYFNIYPPFFYYISYFLAKILGIYFFEGLLFLSRMITILSTLTVSLIIFLICKKLKYNCFASLTASLFFLGHPILFVWGFVGRIDMLAVLFSVLSLYTFLLNKNKPWPYLSIY